MSPLFYYVVLTWVAGFPGGYDYIGKGSTGDWVKYAYEGRISRSKLKTSHLLEGISLVAKVFDIYF